jgi:hypothetical protein
MKMTALTYLCWSCHELFERAPRGTCPVCQSQNVHPLTTHFQSPRERIAWLRRIYGNRLSVVLIPLAQKQDIAKEVPNG